jgi:tight adherence protein B
MSRRSASDELADRASALRSLAALLRATSSPRESLFLWPEDAPDSLRIDLERMNRRLILGASTCEAIESLSPALGQDARSLQVLFALSGLLGGDLARVVDELARTIERRRAVLQNTRAAIAGMTLSARIIASLPLLCIPLLPASGVPLVDPAGLLLVCMGVALTGIGMRWMNGLAPRPPHTDDGICSMARLAASALAGGASLQATFEATSKHAPDDLRDDLTHAAKLNRLGVAWSTALRRTGNPGLIGMSVTLDRVARKGLPAATGLETFAAERDSQAARELDASMRRAPVLMAIPLVACILPSFLLLGVAPFLRGLAL